MKAAPAFSPSYRSRFLSGLIVPGLILALAMGACRETGAPGDAQLVTTTLVASDVSRPTGPGGEPAVVTGSVTLSGLTVELWNGEAWYTVVSGVASATIEIGDGAAAVTLMPATDIPAGDYTLMRLAVTEMVGDLTVDLDGQRFAAQLRTEPGESLTIEKAVTVTENADGSRTLTVELQLVRTITVVPGAGQVVVNGDLGTVTASATMPGTVVASDVSNPIGPDGRPMNLSGTATFTGLTVELWDGQAWHTVADGDGSAVVTLGDGSVSATLVPPGDLPAGTYERIRITAVEARIDLTVEQDGEQFAASVAGNGQFEIERPVEVTVNEDGSRTIRVTLVMIRTVVVSVDPGNGAASVTISGEWGAATAPAARQ